MFGYIIILLLLLGIIGKLFLVVRTFLLKRQEKRRLEAIENEKLERLKTHKYFFEHCLKYPLDIQQRRAIVSEAENVLVVSSAGSGKTSTIVGKVKYLTEKLHIDPRRILLISYTNKAAAELTERINKPGLRGYTFHKLALDIIGKQTNVKPSICENTDALIVQVIRELSKNKKFRKNLTSYLADYKDIESEEEKELKLAQQELANQKKPQLKSMYPDKDGLPVYVRSNEELKLCAILTSLGVSYKYEQPYQHPVSDAYHAQYKPDFSIYYEKDGRLNRIYLEHFGVDEHGLVPSWFAQEKGISFEEANQKYNDGISWKIMVHKKFGTTLITTSSADFQFSVVRARIRKELKRIGVPMVVKEEDELFDLLLPQKSAEEKAFMRLIVTFIMLLKTSCMNLVDVLSAAQQAKDKRNVFLIKYILKPVFEAYQNALRLQQRIDFTDAIIQATALCNRFHPVSYDYIIVDEFQDISIDRYNFLLALRGEDSPAQLYCVGDDWQSIYRFSGSDMSLFRQFPDYFGPTDIERIETTYRFGQPLVDYSCQFIMKNSIQYEKHIHAANKDKKTSLYFYAYHDNDYCDILERIINNIPADKSIYLIGRYSFDDIYLSKVYKSFRENGHFYYLIGGRKIEFLTVHKSKGLEADYAILLQCNNGTFGFPSQMSDDPVLKYVLSEGDAYPNGEERRLFYVAITRAKEMTLVMYDERNPSVFVTEFLHPEKVSENGSIHRNADKRWTKKSEKFLLDLYREGHDINYISQKMGRSKTAIIYRLNKLKIKL